MDMLRLFRQGVRSTRRPQARRQPLLESLEGRELQSVIHGGHIGTSVAIADVSLRKHVGPDVALRKHVGPDVALRKHIVDVALPDMHRRFM